MPTLADLSGEQKRVMLAPMDRCILVTGPPGSGKTVVAFVRSIALTKQGKDHQVGMYNSVLASYTNGVSLPGGETTPSTTTVNQWVRKWWRGIAHTTIPTHDPNDSGYKESDYLECVKQLVVNKDAWITRPEIDWGHLIIDEGQDFSKTFYQLLSLVQRFREEAGDGVHVPALTVLADENQRITDQQSLISEIRAAIASLDDERVFSLTKNYRNTREIARFAQCFFADMSTGVTELPDRRGETPRILSVRNQKAAIDRIVNHIERHSGDEVGVLVNYRKQCYAYYMSLRERLEGHPNIRVQGYASGYKSMKKARDLQFDRPGTVTVLCYGSGKGLEFDTVFLPELQAVNPATGSEEDMMMKMYTMCSRARTRLCLMHRGTADRFLQSAGRWFPVPSDGVAIWGDG